MLKQKKIAIVYDWLDSWGGVERVLLTFHEMFPEAVFFTSYYNPQKASWAKDFHIKSSFIQAFPEFIKNSRLLSTPFYPYAFESFDFKDYDLVISVSSSFAKGIITRPETQHICYLLTPTRFLWSHASTYLNGWRSELTSSYIETLRNWDMVASQRPDSIISISNVVAARCKKYYRRESRVICPPFDIEYWNKFSGITLAPLFEKQYYLVVSRLEKYKKVDQVIEVFNRRTDDFLVVVGTGRDEAYLQKIAGENISFLNNVSDKDLASLYTHANGLIMPQEEDFGYVALEAQYFGCPVIAYGAGGALETVKDGVGGVLYPDQTVESLQSGLEKYHMISYNIKRTLQKDLESPIERFSKENFIKSFLISVNH